MRFTILLVVLSLAILAGRAAAVTGALTLGGCPGDATVTTQVSCVGGGSADVMGTLQPEHAIGDAVAVEGDLRLTMYASDFTASPFWNFDPSGTCYGANAPLSATGQKPASGCSAYAEAFYDPAGGSAWVAMELSPNAGRIVFTVYRTTPVAVAQGEPLFGFRLAIGLASASEAGGACAGCSLPVRLDLYGGIQSQSGTDDDIDRFVCYHSDCAAPISSLLLHDAAVPVARTSWGALKALSR